MLSIVKLNEVMLRIIMLSVVILNVVVLNVVAPDTETQNIDHKIICFFQHSVFHMEHKASYCLDQSGGQCYKAFHKCFQ
jgi:hypothetical protein